CFLSGLYVSVGLDNIVLLTMRNKSELRVDMEDWEGGKVYAQYTSFSVDPESFGYTLHLGSFIHGGGVVEFGGVWRCVVVCGGGVVVCGGVWRWCSGVWR